MCFVASSVALTACLLNLHHHSPERPVPSWMRKIVLQCLARVVCWRQSSCRRKSVIEIEQITNGKEINDTIGTPDKGTSHWDAYFQHKLENAKEKSRLTANKTDWEDVVRVLDRLFFLLHLLLQLVFIPHIFSKIMSHFIESNWKWSACIDMRICLWRFWNTYEQTKAVMAKEHLCQGKHWIHSHGYGES